MPNDKTGERRMEGRPRFLWDMAFATVLRMGGQDLANRFAEELLNSFCKEMGDGPVSVISSRLEEAVDPEAPKEKFIRIDVVAENKKFFYDYEIQLRSKPDVRESAVTCLHKLTSECCEANQRGGKEWRARILCLCGRRTGLPMEKGHFIYTEGLRCVTPGVETIPFFKSWWGVAYVDLAVAEDLWRSLGGRKAPIELLHAHMISSGIENGEMRGGANRSGSEVLGRIQDLWDGIYGDRDGIRAACEERGEARGLEKGRAEGAAGILRKAAPAMAKAGHSIEAIADMLGLSVQEVSKYL